MIVVRFRSALGTALAALVALLFSGCAGSLEIPVVNPNDCAVYLCESFNHDQVEVFAGKSRVFTGRISTQGSSNLAGSVIVPASGKPFVLKVEVPERQARLVQTIDPKRGRFVMIGMDRNYQLSITQRVDQPLFD
jgi:hypothetical protein